MPCSAGAAGPCQPLKASFRSFLNNLAPRNKLLAAGIVLGVAVLAGWIGLYLKGGTTDMTTLTWIILMVVFGIIEAATAA